MKKLIVLGIVSLGAVAGYRWYHERSAQKASWSTATDPVH